MPLLIAAFVLLWALLVTGPVHAQDASRTSYIRDAEIENTIRTFVTPIFEAAGLPPNDIRIIIIDDKRLNAFVAGGLNIFINSGLIQRVESPNQLIGVIAHETGHIAGGHLARMQEEMKGLSTQAIIGMVLGAAAAVATGKAGALMAGNAAGMQAAERNFLSYSRTQESAADQAGLRFLEATHQSARGLADFLDVLADQELLSVGRQDPYLRTHPITRDRVEAVHAFADRSKWKDAPDPPAFIAAHARMRAKLDGYMEPRLALSKYRESDKGVPARYARAIAYYRLLEIPKALQLLEGLIAEFPQDPYFHELRGQILFENGRVPEAVTSYETAVRLLPDAALIRRDYARAEMETGDPGRLKHAIRDLEQVVRQESDDSGAWRLLGTAYGKDDQIGMASLALAQAAIIRGERREARAHAERAQRLLPHGSPAWLRAEDIRIASRRDRDGNDNPDGVDDEDRARRRRGF